MRVEFRNQLCNNHLLSDLTKSCKVKMRGVILVGCNFRNNYKSYDNKNFKHVLAKIRGYTPISLNSLRLLSLLNGRISVKSMYKDFFFDRLYNITCLYSHLFME